MPGLRKTPTIETSPLFILRGYVMVVSMSEKGPTTVNNLTLELCLRINTSIQFLLPYLQHGTRTGENNQLRTDVSETNVERMTQRIARY